MVDDSPRCGYVAIVGRPNVGKSTLTNHLLGFKLSITSRKPQTTRHNLLGVDTQDHVQAIYVDTPGIHADGGRALNRYMVRSAMSVLADVDLVVMVVDRDRFTPEDEFVLEHVKRSSTPAIVVVNKVDLLQDQDLTLPALARLDTLHSWRELLVTSALKNRGVDRLRRAVAAQLPLADHVFPPDQLTDRSERFICAEIVREKLIRRLGDELPHQLTVVIESYREKPHLVEIHALIVVEKAGQRRILIGSGGERIKAVGSDARRDIEAMLGRQVLLKLWVKVDAGWSDNAVQLKRFGYD